MFCKFLGLFGASEPGDPFYTEAAAGQVARMTSTALGSAVPLRSPDSRASKTIYRTESRFQRWCFGFHQSQGDAPG